VDTGSRGAAEGDENGVVEAEAEVEVEAEADSAATPAAASAVPRRSVGGKGSRGGGGGGGAGSRWSRNGSSTNLADGDGKHSQKQAEARVHPYVWAAQNILSVREHFALKNIFARDADRMRAVNAVYYMSELQRSANEFVPARDHSEMSLFNHRLLLQQHTPSVIAEQLLLPPTHDINQAVDLLDQHVDVLYNCLKSIREKQFMSEGGVSFLFSFRLFGTCAEPCPYPPHTGVMKEQQEEATKRQGGGASAVVSPVPAKNGAAAPNLKEIERNNKLRTVEAHLYATIVNNPVVAKPVVAAVVTPEAAKDSKRPKSSGAADAPQMALDATPTLPVNKRGASGADSAPHSRSGSFSYSAKSMKPHTQVVLAQSQAQGKADPKTAAHQSSGGSAVGRNSKQHAAHAAAAPPAVSSAAAVGTITAAVEAHMVGHGSSAAPADTPMFQSNQLKAAKNKAAITAEIRRRALERRRGWEMLGDAYLEVNHKWTAHVEQVEKDEGGLKEGPKLRGSASALFGGGIGIGALGSPGGIASGLHAGLGLPAGLSGLSGQLAALGGVGGDQLGAGIVATRSFDLAAASSRASGLGIARSDYEQVHLDSSAGLIC
jgi:hypothetical protein